MKHWKHSNDIASRRLLKNVQLSWFESCRRWNGRHFSARRLNWVVLRWSKRGLQIQNPVVSMIFNPCLSIAYLSSRPEQGTHESVMKWFTMPSATKRLNVARHWRSLVVSHMWAFQRQRPSPVTPENQEYTDHCTRLVTVLMSATTELSCFLLLYHLQRRFSLSCCRSSSANLWSLCSGLARSCTEISGAHSFEVGTRQ